MEGTKDGRSGLVLFRLTIAREFNLENRVRRLENRGGRARGTSEGGNAHFSEDQLPDALCCLARRPSLPLNKLIHFPHKLPGHDQA